MVSRVIHARTDEKGVLTLTVPDLPPGEVEVILRIPESADDRRATKDIDRLPLGGYRAGWLKPEQLRREAIYEEDA